MLTTDVTTYLAARRAVGFKLRDHEGILRDFAAFASAKGDTHVRSITVREWVGQGSKSPLRNCVRWRTVVRFARYLYAEDPRHEIPPEDACGRHRPQRRPPFLFSPRDVGALVGAALTLGPPSSLQPRVYGTLFGLLAATGLRISEALNLRFEDVTEEGLVVRDTKFLKSRLLPLLRTTSFAAWRRWSHILARTAFAAMASSPTAAGFGRCCHRRAIGCRQRVSWANLLCRVLSVDALACPRCSTRERHVPMTVLAFLTDPDVVGKILRHLGLPTSAPALAAAARAPQPELGFTLAGEDGEPERRDAEERDGGEESGPRGPPS